MLQTDAFTEIREFKDNVVLNTQWTAFDPVKNSKLLFEEVIDRLITFIEPIYEMLIANQDFNKNWSCKSKMWN